MSEPLDFEQHVLYEGQLYRLGVTEEFSRWLGSLRDRRASAKIGDRLLRAADGNFGDVRSAGRGVSELRIDYGPGYRVYFVRREQHLIVLLCGGDKRTQDNDIVRAKRLKAEMERRYGNSPL